MLHEIKSFKKYDFQINRMVSIQKLVSVCRAGFVSGLTSRLAALPVLILLASSPGQAFWGFGERCNLRSNPDSFQCLRSTLAGEIHPLLNLNRSIDQLDGSWTPVLFVDSDGRNSNSRFYTEPSNSGDGIDSRLVNQADGTLVGNLERQGHEINIYNWTKQGFQLLPKYDRIKLLSNRVIEVQMRAPGTDRQVFRCAQYSPVNEADQLVCEWWAWERSIGNFENKGFIKFVRSQGTSPIDIPGNMPGDIPPGPQVPSQPEPLPPVIVRPPTPPRPQQPTPPVVNPGGPQPLPQVPAPPVPGKPTKPGPQVPPPVPKPPGTIPAPTLPAPPPPIYIPPTTPGGDAPGDFGPTFGPPSA
jgi:hypothetical protein